MKTKESQEKVLKFYKTLKISDLRKRQSLCREQIELAFKQKNDDAVENLGVMDAILTEAIIFVEFGEKK